MLSIRYKNSVYYIEYNKHDLSSMEYSIIKMFLIKHNIDIEKTYCNLMPKKEEGFIHKYLCFKDENDANIYVNYINSLIIANKLGGD